MERFSPNTLLKLALAGLAVLPVLALFFIFRERPFAAEDNFAYLRIGLVLVSFMIYMIGKYMVGFLKMTKLPGFFPSLLAGTTVVFIIVTGILASFYGKWWAEYLPHGAIGAYAAWRMKV